MNEAVVQCQHRRTHKGSLPKASPVAPCIAEPSWALFGERHGKYLLLAPDYELLAEDEETAVKVLAAANGLAFRA